MLPLIVVVLWTVGATLVLLTIGFVIFRRRAVVLGDKLTEIVFDATGVVLAIMVGGATLAYAYSNERRVDRQEKREFASKVYMGEAPQYYSGPDGISEDKRCDAEDNCRDRVIINASGTQINNVWVEYEQADLRQMIQGVQRCTLYDLKRYPDPEDEGDQIEPRYLYFTDAHGKWRRSADGSLDEDTEYDGKIPDDAEFLGSNALDIRDCSG